jgi:hypothetical protein
MSPRKYISIAAGIALAACSSADIVAPRQVADGSDPLLATVASSKYGFAIAYVLVGGGNIDWYGFNASDETGSVTGKFRLYQVRIAKGDGTNSYATVNVSGTVSGMKVEGKKARLGGFVTTSDFSGLPVGTPMTWSVSDNVDGTTFRRSYREWDTASSLYAGVNPKDYCNLGLAYPEEPIFLGDLAITQ